MPYVTHLKTVFNVYLQLQHFTTYEVIIRLLYAGYKSGTSMLTEIFKIPKNTHNEYHQALRVTVHGVWIGHQIHGILTDHNCK